MVFGGGAFGRSDRAAVIRTTEPLSFASISPGGFSTLHTELVAAVSELSRANAIDTWGWG
jgi:hypothetical protein